MPVTKGQNFQDVQEGALPVAGKPARTTNEAVLAALDKHINAPVRLYATQPLADALLNIGPSRVELGDGAGRSAGPNADIVGDFPVSSINFQTGALTGGTITNEGAAFALPTGSTIGQFRRVAFTYIAETDTVDCIFSDEDATFGNLPNPGALFAAIEGQPIGWLDIEATATDKYKTRGSTTDIIENKAGANITLYRFGGGTGAGAGGDTSFRLNSVTSNIGIIKKGFLDASGKQLVSYNGVADETDITLNLKTEVNSTGITSPAINTTYYLYIDLNFLPEVPVLFGSDQHEVYRVEKGVDKPLVVLAETPEDADKTRYVHISAIRTDGAGDYVFGSDLARRTHSTPNVAISPIAEIIPLRVIGSVGQADQIAGGHVKQAESFPYADLTALVSFWNLNGLLDGSVNGNDLTNNGATPFTEVGILGDTAPDFDGAGTSLSSTAALLNAGDSDFTVDMWVKATDWTPASPQSIVSQNGSTTDRGWNISITTTDILIEFADSATTFATALSSTLNQSFVNGSWHHIAVVYRASDDDVSLYIDGALADSTVAPNTPRLATSPIFRIGAFDGSSQFFDGVIDEVGYVAAELKATDISKLHAARIDLVDQTLNPEFQQWRGRYVREDGFIDNELGNEWLIAKLRDRIYVDFGGDSLDQIELYKADRGAGGRVRQVNVFDRTYTADPTGDVPHLLGQTPTDFVVLHNELADGFWAPLDPSSFVKASVSDLRIDTTALLIDATHPIRIIARVGQKLVAAAETFGFTHFVNAPFATPNNFTTIDAAMSQMQAGDSLLVMGSYQSATAPIVSVNDVAVKFMPGVEVEITGTPTSCFRINASRVKVDDPNVRITSSGAIASGYIMAGGNDDSELRGARITTDNAGMTLATAFELPATHDRNFIRGVKFATQGSITAALLDNGADNDAVIRG